MTDTSGSRNDEAKQAEPRVFRMERDGATIEVWASGAIKIEVGGSVHVRPPKEWHRLAQESFRSEKRISPVGLVKMILGQRDELWEAALAVLKHCDAKPEGETDFERAVIALRAACDKVPSYRQRLENIFNGIADVE